MTPVAIAAACGFFFSPPPSYDTLPLPAGAVVFELPFADIAEVCKGSFIGHGKIV